MNSMRGTRLVLTALVLGAVLAVPGHAGPPTSGPYLTIAPVAGWVDWSKDIDLENRFLVGGRVGFMMSPHFGVEGFLNRIVVDNLGRPKSAFNTLQYGGNVVVNLVPQGKVVPFLTAGWQRARFDPTRPAPGTAATPEVAKVTKDGPAIGFGVKIPVLKIAALRLEGSDNVWSFRGGPAVAPGLRSKTATHSQTYLAGVEIAIGGTRVQPDTDNDGVPDKEDKCPNTPAGAQVDMQGCPVDSDHDGVYDGIDQCPNTPKGATVDMHGCPIDTDHDGVSDGIDECPDTPKGATVDMHGCPVDTDGDGVYDGIDECGDTPKGAVVDGKGCPIDSDADGVPDGLDKCPDTASGTKVDREGCPVQTGEVVPPPTPRAQQLIETGTLSLQDVQFVTGSAELQPQSLAVLDEVGAALAQRPDLRIDIAGHTDSQGAARSNLALSEKRAQTVLGYLVGKFGLSRDRFTTHGFGSSKPVAPNETPDGRAKNRRVEFQVIR